MHLETHRTRVGYVAALRMQDGSEIGRGECSINEAAGYLEQLHGAEVGAFSFGGLARAVGRLASRIAKMKALRSALGAMAFLPPPVGTVAATANKAMRAIAAVKKGNPAAVAAWRAAAERARAAPHSPTAVAMRLAMQAAGRPAAPGEPDDDAAPSVEGRGRTRARRRARARAAAAVRPLEPLATEPELEPELESDDSVEGWRDGGTLRLQYAPRDGRWERGGQVTVNFDAAEEIPSSSSRSRSRSS